VSFFDHPVEDDRNLCAEDEGVSRAFLFATTMPAAWHNAVVRRFLLSATFACAWLACGGKAVIDPVPEQDPTRDSATSSGQTTGTTSSSTDVGSSSSATGSSSGATGSSSGGGGDEGACPPDKPEPGVAEPCAPDGLVCDYGGFCNFVICEGGDWIAPIC
jgi:hypothetical protein